MLVSELTDVWTAIGLIGMGKARNVNWWIICSWIIESLLYIFNARKWHREHYKEQLGVRSLKSL